MWCGALRSCLEVKCHSLLSSVHTMLVNILRCVRLHITQKYYYYFIRCEAYQVGSFVVDDSMYYIGLNGAELLKAWHPTVAFNL